MTDAASLTFHVVFVPGTVRDLRIFMPSLAAWGGGCQLRLVSNGCSRAEDELLRQLVKLSPRFEFYRLPGRQTWKHGVALSYLQRRETSPQFAFLDSDIFATGDFHRDLYAQSGAVDALFSCPPVWSNDRFGTLPHGFKYAKGEYRQMEDGFCIGSTYFAIYDNRVLADCLATHRIDLRPYLWENIPTAIQERLVIAGRKMNLYDTAKLVNILLNLDGRACRFVATRTLHHVGGASCVALSPGRYLYGLLRCGWGALPRVGRRIAMWAGIYNGWRERVSSDEVRWIDARSDRVRSACAHIYRLLRTLDSGQPQGVIFASGDADLDAEMGRMEAIIRHLHPTWCAWLDGREPIVASSVENWTPDVGNAKAA